MSRFAVPALILLACDSHKGEWLTVPRLVARIVAPMDVIRQAADRLVELNQLQHATRNGEHLYGIGVEGVAP